MIPTWMCPWNCNVTGKHVLLAMLWDRSVRFGTFYNICIVPFILSLLEWWKERNGIITTQLAKFTETLKLAWPKAFPLVFLNLKVIPFGKHKLSEFEIIAGRPMHLALSVLQLIKNDMLDYCKALIIALCKNATQIALFPQCGPRRWRQTSHSTTILFFKRFFTR